ncbi:hypothetical protein CEUSTIGMA_g4185.t1 [Chlamydomonas eustigma]|uniref:ribonuclease Z n=1 Tax=Chlamydomonas eustigma TaxID=1157962 RepID=A0A250X0Y7_9CHLO|nr:hypothetical protein CEUSTIGMA_g4185.t1 [Chlamydomonas eustigma]|eukprot:GAX76738.1 hypothetical protein CEUSTIGMA_g4185.t1 [Chlamydomonas eustigma]
MKCPYLDVTLISSHGDGVRPSLLISLKAKQPFITPIEYLFNVPAGFSRLALEHRVRPSLGLRAVLVTSSAYHAMGGLGGLILRLRTDGHGSVKICGPQGIKAAFAGLHEFVRCETPVVEVSELSSTGVPNGADVGHSDEMVDIMPIWPSGLAWQAPTWLQEHKTALPVLSHDKPEGVQEEREEVPERMSVVKEESVQSQHFSNNVVGDTTSSSSSSSSEGSSKDGTSGDEGSALKKTAGIKASSVVQHVSKSGIRSGGGTNEWKHGSDKQDKTLPKTALKQGITKNDIFQELDALFTSRAEETMGARRDAMLNRHSRQGAGMSAGHKKKMLWDCSKQSVKRGTSNSTQVSDIRTQVFSALQAKQLMGTASNDQQASTSASIGISAPSFSPELAKFGPKIAGHTNRFAPQKGIASPLIERGASVNVGMRALLRDKGPSSQVIRRPDGQPAAAAGQLMTQQHQNVGFLIHLKESGKVLAVICCPHLMLLTSLKRHPVFTSYLKEAANQGKLLGTCHLTAYEVASSKQYKFWMKSLPGRHFWPGKQEVATLSPCIPVMKCDGVRSSRDQQDAAPENGRPSGGMQDAIDENRPNGGQNEAGVQSQLGLSDIQQKEHLSAVTEALRSGVDVNMFEGRVCCEDTALLKTGLVTGVPEMDDVLGSEEVLASFVTGTRPGPAHLKEIQSMGFRAAARVSCRLNLISAALFPLPYVLRPSERFVSAMSEQKNHKTGVQESAKGACHIKDAGDELLATTTSGGSSHDKQGGGSSHDKQGGGTVPVPAKNVKVMEVGVISKISWALRAVDGNDVSAGALKQSDIKDNDVQSVGTVCSSEAVDVLECQRDVLSRRMETLSTLIKELRLSAPMLSVNVMSDMMDKQLPPHAESGALDIASQTRGAVISQEHGDLADVRHPKRIHRSSTPVGASAHPSSQSRGKDLIFQSHSNQTHNLENLQSISGLKISTALSAVVGPPLDSHPPPEGWLLSSVRWLMNSHNDIAAETLPNTTTTTTIGRWPQHQGATTTNTIGRWPQHQVATTTNTIGRWPQHQGATTTNTIGRGPQSATNSNRLAAKRLRESLKGKQSTAGSTAVVLPQVVNESVVGELKAEPEACSTGQAAANMLDHECKQAGSQSQVAAGAAFDTLSTASESPAPVPHLDVTGLHGEDKMAADSIPPVKVFDEEPVPECLQSSDASQTALMFLGTGSAEPSKYRGPSAILLMLPEARSMMIDCGEGTWGQMVRMLGLTQAKRMVNSLVCIWISHKHADHVLGLEQLLAQRPAGDSSSLLVAGPSEVGRWLLTAQKQKPAWRASFVHCRQMLRRHLPLVLIESCQGPAVLASSFQHWEEHLPWGPPSGLSQVNMASMRVLSNIGFSQWCSVPVHHCHDSWGLVLKHSTGWSLVYSGDTRPSKQLQQYGRNATLLIHEATFEPDLQQMAIRKRHSTSKEAREMAVEMQAYRTILTHFSQRYPRCPEGLDSTEMPLRRRPLIAFDGLFVLFSMLPVMPLVGPAVAEVLSKEEEVDVAYKT